MSRVTHTLNLYQALKDEGFELPPECGDVILTMPVDGLYQLHYVVNLYDERLAKLGRALVRMAESAMKANRRTGDGLEGEPT